MDRTALIAQLKSRKALLAGLGSVAVIALTVGIFVARKPAKGHDLHAASGKHAASQNGGHGADADEDDGEEDSDEEGGASGHAAGHATGHGSGHDAGHSTGHGKDSQEGLITTVKNAFASIQDKVDAIRIAETENERLKLENAHLRLELESANFKARAKEDSHKTASNPNQRELSSSHYVVPTDLVPSQLYTLGVSYFKAHEDEKAAVIFTFLTGLKDNDAFKTPKNYLMTGVAWYRMDNYATADKYFDLVLRSPEQEGNASPSGHGAADSNHGDEHGAAKVAVAKSDNRPLHAHARLWKALVASRLGKQAKTQFWLTELIDHHPHSLEAKWVNPQTHAEAGGPEKVEGHAKERVPAHGHAKVKATAEATATHPPATEAHRGVASEHH